jgi:hypothetical protein
MFSAFLGLYHFVFYLVKIVVPVRLLESIKENVEGADTGSVINRKTAEQGV